MTDYPLKVYRVLGLAFAKESVANVPDELKDALDFCTASNFVQIIYVTPDGEMYDPATRMMIQSWDDSPRDNDTPRDTVLGTDDIAATLWPVSPPDEYEKKLWLTPEGSAALALHRMRSQSQLTGESLPERLPAGIRKFLQWMRENPKAAVPILDIPADYRGAMAWCLDKKRHWVQTIGIGQPKKPYVQLTRVGSTKLQRDWALYETHGQDNGHGVEPDDSHPQYLGLILNEGRRTVRRDGEQWEEKTVDLSSRPTEWTLLKRLVREKGTIVSPSALENELWRESEVEDKPDHPKDAIAAHISKLRTSLRPLGVKITNRRNVGYWLEDPS